jgi:hypothetical protein
MVVSFAVKLCLDWRRIDYFGAGRGSNTMIAALFTVFA